MPKRYPMMHTHAWWPRQKRAKRTTNESGSSPLCTDGQSKLEGLPREVHHRIAEILDLNSLAHLRECSKWMDRAVRRQLNRRRPSGLERLPPELHKMITAEMDIPSLMVLRGSCETMYVFVDAKLKELLRAIILHYVSDADSFLNAMYSNKMLITGEAALAFILRDLTLLTDTLELVVGRTHRTDIAAQLGREGPRKIPAGESLILRTSLGQYLKILVSRTDDALAAITNADRATFCLAFMNFVSVFGWGCASPLYTLQRLAIASPEGPGYEPDEVTLRREYLRHHGFRLDDSPARLLDLDVWSPRACFRRHFACPDQTRFFGDGGSLVGFFDIWNLDVGAVARANFAPFNPSTVWRLDVRKWDSWECDGGCRRREGILTNDEEAMGGRTVSVPRKLMHYGPRFYGVNELYDRKKSLLPTHPSPWRPFPTWRWWGKSETWRKLGGAEDDYWP